MNIRFLQYDIFRSTKPYISYGKRACWYIYVKAAAKITTCYISSSINGVQIKLTEVPRL